MTSDEDLMHRYTKGDQEAFRQLYERYSPALERLMRRRIADRDEARDLVQQTFLQFHRARADFQAGSRVKPWLYTIALNLRHDRLRRLARSRLVPVAQVPEGAVPPEDPDRGRRALRVRAAVAELPEKYRLAIELHWFEEMSFREVSQVLGVGLSAVKTRAHRAYEMLRGALGDDAM